jgi:hypothetical protein
MPNAHHCSTIALGVLAGAGLLAVHPPAARARGQGRCPAGMANVLGRYCIDRYEASLVEVNEHAALREHSPYVGVAGLRVIARSRRGVIPQGYISRDEAEVACRRAKKRLCSDDEWLTACRGPRAMRYPYGDEAKPGYCNDSGLSPLRRLFNAEAGQIFDFDHMNDPRLNQLSGTLAKSGSFARCRSAFGVWDMVGNLHEWTAAPQGTFRGGYYLDTHLNGEGCEYRTTRHSPRYHDYSTGFRCCASARH